MGQPRNVFAEFLDHFKPRREAMEPTPEMELDFREEIRDRRAWVSTDSYRKYKSMLVQEVDSLAPDPKGGTDAAAACAFMQAGLKRAIEILDNMAGLAKENPDG